MVYYIRPFKRSDYITKYYASIRYLDKISRYLSVISENITVS